VCDVSLGQAETFAPVSQYVMLVLDANAINARQADPDPYQIERWRADEVVIVIMSTHSSAEARAGGNSARSAKASSKLPGWCDFQGGSRAVVEHSRGTAREKTYKSLRLVKPFVSLRDRGVGGSNPLAPTNFS
jgi:hypothetical protein